MLSFNRVSQQRTMILQRFRLLFRLADRKFLAEQLKVSEKQVQRYLQGESEPAPKVLRAMQDLIEQQKSDIAFMGLLEQLRAEAEKEQQKNPHIEIEGIEEREMPGWYLDARADIVARRYGEALVMLRQRRKYRDDWERIPAKTQPYVLGSLGLAAYYTGRWAEAEEAFVAALDLTRSLRNDTPPLFLATYSCNLGLARMRQVRYDAAFLCFDEAARILPTFLANYYNAICAASRMEDGEWVGHWSGRLAAAADKAEASDIAEVLSAYPSDADLVFARECDTFSLAIANIEAVYSRMSKGDRHGS